MKLETGNWKLASSRRTTDYGASADHRRGDSRRGVALIVVLGFLSIMVIMAVAFLTHARTERMVADYTLEAQRGRQIVRTALNAAMYEFSTELYNENRLMVPPLEPVNYTVFTSVRPSGQQNIGDLGDDEIYLMDGEAYDWIPARYRTEDVEDQVFDAQWVLVREGSGAQSRILGRYAYAIFDMSGGIDANFIALADGVAGAGDPTNRPNVRWVGMGTDANPLLAETINAGEFKRLRTGWHGFDTLSEIIRLTDGHYIDGQSGFETGDTPAYGRYPANIRWRGNRVERFPALNKTNVTDLVPYSLASLRGIYNFASGRWEIGQVMALDRMGEGSGKWTSAEWGNFRNNILSQVGGQLQSVDDTINALRDYVNESPIPLGVDYPSVKNVPMFNEIGLDFELAHDAASIPPVLVLTVGMEFEVWYPFPSEDNAAVFEYVIPAPVIMGGFAPRGPEESDFWLRCRLANGENVELTANTPPSLTLENQFNNGTPYKVDGRLEYSVLVEPLDTNYVVQASDILQVRTLVGRAQMTRGGAAVDRLEFTKAVNMNLSAGGDGVELYYEVDDPRLNHISDRWSRADEPSWNDINPAATAAGYGAPGGEGLYMYCRNEPMLSPGEFGFIPTGRAPPGGTPAWQTIDLCTPEGARMLARLVATTDILTAIQTGPYNTFYTNATINPNTTSTNVLKAAFAGLTRREVPNAPDLPLNALSGEDAELLAGSMLFESRTKQIVATGGAFMYGSDWVRVPAMQKEGSLAMVGLNKNERESLIRNTWGLFNPNNTMFTVLVIAQAIKEGPGRVGIWDPDEDMITGERRAVALVWRDPTPIGANPRHHEMYVRMFKLLDE